MWYEPTRHVILIRLWIETLIEETKISFNKAWRDFLLVRPFTRNAQIEIVRNESNVVTNVKIYPFDTFDRGEEHYIIDNVSCPGSVLAFPRQIVQEALERDVLQKVLGKTLTNEQLGIMKSKLDADLERTTARLGCANIGEIKEAIGRKDFWQVLFSIHQLAAYRLHKLLVFKSSNISIPNSEIAINPIKEKTCSELRTFQHLIDICYLIGAINDRERTKAYDFNEDRNNIAHYLLEGKVTDSLLENACTHGLEVLALLEDALQRIVPKPELIIMDSFLIHEFL